MDGSLFSFRFVLRIIAVVLVVLMFGFMARNSVVISQGNEQIQSQQLETLTKLLISQAALSASQPLADQDQEALLGVAQNLARDRLVFDATIYDAEGVKLAASSNAMSAREVLGLDTPLETASIGRQQLVEPVVKDNSVIGFVRITFETGRVTAISDHHYRKSDRAMYLMIITSFLSGLILALLVIRRPRGVSRQENLLLKSQD